MRSSKIYKELLFFLKMKKLFISLVVLLLVVIAGFYLISNTNLITGNVISDNSDQENNGDIKTFVITSSRLRFYMNGIENPDMRVKEGDRVKIEFTSEEGFHDWRIDEFNAATQKVRPGNETTFVEFIADKKGKFEYYCTVGQHRANGMKGNFIVE